MSEATVKPKARIKTSLGDIVVQLDGEEAPESLKNFVQYAKDDYYVGTVFHRVIPGFMIQAGGLTEDMQKKSEGLRGPIKNEWTNNLKNKRGTLAMARLGGDPDSATSQFFINDADNAFLDQPQPDGAGYAVFGEVIEGMDVVDKIVNADLIRHPAYPAPQAVTPRDPIFIEKVEMLDELQT
ncbi:MAG: peptidylprolyl isomerase [Candidatus Sumerlaeota bacterium]